MLKNVGLKLTESKVFPAPKSYLTKTQSQAIRKLKRDRDCIVLTADKGVAMVIMDMQDYINKSNNLLNSLPIGLFTRTLLTPLKQIN